MEVSCGCGYGRATGKPIAFGQGTAPVVSCESLAKLTLQETTVTLAQEYAAGEYQAPAPRSDHLPALREHPVVPQPRRKRVTR